MGKVSALEAIESGAVDGSYLNSIVEIEDILLRIQKHNREIERLKALKKYRVESADLAIQSLENQVKQFRDLIQTTMVQLEPDEKTLDFPSVAKVTRRSTKGSWSIRDEQTLMAFLEKEDKKSAVTKPPGPPKLDVRKAYKLFDEYEKNGKNIPGISKEPDKESLSITFEQESQRKAQPVVRPKSTSLDDLETLEV